MQGSKPKHSETETDAVVKFRLEELVMMLEAVRAVGIEFEAKVKETGELTSRECHEIMLRLQALYGSMRSTAPAYVNALQAVLHERVGNVERIRPGIDRRRSPRKLKDSA